MQYVLFYLIGSALCYAWVYTSITGITVREMMIDEIASLDQENAENQGYSKTGAKVDENGEYCTYEYINPRAFADIFIFFACLLAWPVLLIGFLRKR